MERTIELTVPKGWKLVPEDPDDEMIDAACDASGAYRVDFVRAYAAALAKAPQPPAVEVVKPKPTPRFEWIDMDGEVRRTVDRPNSCQTPLAVRRIGDVKDGDES